MQRVITKVGWPALATHFFCLIVGFGAANFLSQTVEDTLVRIPDKSVLFELQKDSLKGMEVKVEAQTKGEKVFLARKRHATQNLFCRVHERAVLVYGEDERTFVFNSGVGNLHDLIPLLESHAALQRSELHLLPKDKGERLPVCTRQGRVVYES